MRFERSSAVTMRKMTAKGGQWLEEGKIVIYI